MFPLTNHLSTVSSCHDLEKETCTKTNGLRAAVIALIVVMALLLPVEFLLASNMPKKAGWIEEVMISPGGLRFQAKLDTGAKSSSIHAENISSFSRNGQSWVKFDVTDSESKTVTVERKVHRIVKIKRHKQKPSERPVVLLSICLGDHFAETEVNLSDRSNYKYPVLIGRMFLSEHFVVDPSSKHILETSCKIETIHK